MRVHFSGRLVVAVCLLSMCSVDEAWPAPRTVEIAWPERAPVIDGHLDDLCWGQAKAVTGFTLLHTERVSPFQTYGYVAHDSENLYIGMKCLKPHGAKPRGELRRRDEYLFGDDIVEILIDPGATRERYYQIAVNSYGSIWDAARSAGGAQHDPRWDADLQAAAYVDEDYWSMEAAIPFHNFGALADLRRTWGINLCRESYTPYAQSSIAPGGAFHDAGLFPQLTGLQANFSRYSIAVRDAYPRRQPREGALAATLRVPVMNIGDAPRTIRVEQFARGNEHAAQSSTTTLDPGGATELPLGGLELEPLLAGRSDVYLIATAPQTEHLVISDVKSGKILAHHKVREPHYLEVMSLEVADPWQKKMASGPTAEVSLTVTIDLDATDLREGSLHVALLNPKRTAREAVVPIAERTIDAPSEVTKVTFPTHELPWGTYVASAKFIDASGHDLTSTQAPVNVLPGPPNQIVVLNNLVSELANAKDRGLSGGKKIELLNPRDGWVWFQFAGSGNAKIAGLNLRLISGEAMHRLPAGRYTIEIEGGMDEFIARAVPEILYTEYATGPGIDGYDVNLYNGKPEPPSVWSPGVDLGKYEWDFLDRHVLKNCNVIAGDTNDPEHMRRWTNSGRRWIATTGAPGYHMFFPSHEKFAPAAECAQYWSNGAGYQHPLASGAIADDCSTASEAQFIEWARAIRLLRENPRYADRTFYPWAYAAFGSDGSRAFLRTVTELGGKYAYYKYLPEQSTEEEAQQLMQQNYVQSAQSFNKRSWQSVRNMIASPGIMSHPPLNQNVNPAANFKTHMDLQFHTFANDPAFFGLYGVQWYYSAYADEENTRWAGRLYRHYCIEGRTERASSEPYQLAHVTNPDFEQGTHGWNVEAAEADSVRVGQLTGYGAALEGRYLGGNRGDTFLTMKRSAKRPNEVSQPIVNLEPGRLYSIKMITANWDNISQSRSASQPDAVRIKLTGAEVVPGPRRNYWFTYPHNYGLSLGDFSYKNRAYLNYHWYVFRAEAAEVGLTISDWKSDKNPGESVGQQLMLNFIEVQPYFEADDD